MNEENVTIFRSYLILTFSIDIYPVACCYWLTANFAFQPQTVLGWAKRTPLRILIIAFTPIEVYPGSWSQLVELSACTPRP